MYVTCGDATGALNAATCEVRWRHDWPHGVGGPPGTARKVFNAFKSGGVDS